MLQQLALANLQFLTNQVLGTVHRVAKHIAHRQELRLVVLNHATVRRNVDFTVREGIERIQRLVARHTRSQLHLYLDLRSRQVFHVTGLDLALLDGFQNGVDDGLRRLGERNLADDQRLRVQFLYLGTHLQHTTALSVVVFRHVDAATRREVGIKMELLVVQIGNGSVAQLHEVVRQDLGRQTYGNTLGTLCQQQRELHGQRDRLLVTTIV